MWIPFTPFNNFNSRIDKETVLECPVRNIIPSHEKVPNIIRYLSPLFFATSPHLVQNVYMCNSPDQARKALLYDTIFSSSIVACTILVGLFVFVFFPYVQSTDI